MSKPERMTEVIDAEYYFDNDNQVWVLYISVDEFNDGLYRSVSTFHDMPVDIDGATHNVKYNHNPEAD